MCMHVDSLTNLLLVLGELLVAWVEGRLLLALGGA